MFAMAKISAPDGVKLYVETIGSGTSVVFVHEYAGDYRSWEAQVRYFCRQHRCVTYSQRGYPPSDVPSDPGRYSQDVARDDVIAVMDGLGIDKAHVVGHSMGGYTALHVGIRYPQRCLSVTAAGCGWGSSPDAEKREAMKALAAETGKMFAEEGIVAAAAKYADARRIGRRSSTKIRAAGPNSRACSRSTRPRGTRSPCSTFSSNGRRCGKWRPSSSSSRCRSW
jgi:pimeloyl-ACP methyl ester carboxylesterase